MQFADFNLIYLFWLVLLLIIFLVYRFQVYQKLLNNFAESKLLNEIADTGQIKLRQRRFVLLVIAFVLSIVALMRPQWGFEWQEVRREGIDILLAIDTSKSMLTQDVRPNRLERTKLAVKDLVRKLKGDRIGLIAFAGDAFLMCPLTVDYNGFLLSLNDLDTDTVPRGGTNIETAIKEGLKSYEKVNPKYKAIVVMTDGDNLEGDPMSVTKKAKEQNVRIYSIGIGTREGELIQITDDKNQKTFLKDDNGNYVKSRLNEKLLEDVALATGGAYIRASGAEFGLDTIYEEQLMKMEKQEFQNKMQKKYFERFQIPLGLAFIFLCAESFLALKRR